MRDYKLLLISILFVWFAALPFRLQAAPYFYFYGDATVSAGYNKVFTVGLNTDGDRVTAAQSVIMFDPAMLKDIQISNLNSKCSFWAPADPSLGFGTGTTPYITGGNKLVISCGFSNPGYITTNGSGDHIVSFTMKPLVLGNTVFNFSNTQFRYIGTTVQPGSSAAYYITVSEPSTPAPTPTPTPVPLPPPEYLRASDISTVTLGGGTGTRSGTSTQTGVPGSDAINPDNSIPPPPADMEIRPNATPYAYKSDSDSDKSDDGEVLSLQSLQELLIPGKSKADKSLVLFNFIMTLTFLALLAVLIWRLVVSRRANKLKYKHMNEMLEGELAVIESKIAGVKQGVVQDEDVTRTFEDLKREMESNA